MYEISDSQRNVPGILLMLTKKPENSRIGTFKTGPMYTPFCKRIFVYVRSLKGKIRNSELAKCTVHQTTH